jgi:small GTP-binding protein
MAAEFTLGSETPIKEAAETFNVAFGGIQGVGKTTLYNKLKTGEFVEGGSSEQTDQGLDYVVLVKEVEDVTIKISLWDTASLEKFKSMTQSYFRNVHAIILVCRKSRQATLSALTEWLGWVKEYSREQVVVSLWCHKREDEMVDSEDERDIVTDKVMSEFGFTHDIPECMQFTVNAKADDSNVEAAFHEVVEFLHKKQKMISLSPSPGHVGSFKLPETQHVTEVNIPPDSVHGDVVDGSIDTGPQPPQPQSSSKCRC